ncbi:MAG: ABC transporter permease [Candidatus Omnitrophota bacterium]
MKKIAACVKKDFLDTLSYKLPCFLTVCGFVLVLVILCFLPHSFVKRSFVLNPEGIRITYFNFILSGLMLSMYLVSSFAVFSAQIQKIRTIGILEALLVTPTRFITILIAQYIGYFIFASIINIPFLLFISYCLKDLVVSPNIFAIAIIFTLSFILFGAFSIFVASFIIVFEDSRPVTKAIIGCLRICGNIYFPVDILPKSLQLFAYSLPFSHIFRAFRMALFANYTLWDMAPYILILLAFALVLFPLSVWSLNCALRKAKERGTLAKY